MPTNEFFNTGITTYLWCLNKDKQKERKDKVLCINADSLFEKLKKSKGDKTKQLPLHNIKIIASLYSEFKQTEISKIKSKFDFYYNKQKIQKLEIDEVFGSVLKNEKIEDISKIIIKDLEKDSSYEYFDDNGSKYFKYLYIEDNIKCEQKTGLECSVVQSFRLDKEIIEYMKNAENLYIYIESNKDKIEQKNGYIFKNNINIGIGKIKISFSKKMLKGVNILDVNRYSLNATIEQSWIKDDERIEYSSIESENKQKIEEYLLKWVDTNKNHFVLNENIIGVEINFNNIFPKSDDLQDLEQILEEISKIDKQLGEI